MVTTTARREGNQALLVGFWLAGLLNVAAAGAGWDLLGWLTKPLIMLLLLAWAWRVLPDPRPPGGRLLLVGIGFAWLGDVFLMGSGDMFFLLGLCGFLVMQVLYILAFRAVPGTHLLRERWWLGIPFVLVWAGMNALLSPGDLRIPVLIYSAVLLGMSAAALDLLPRLARPCGTRVFVGSVLFVVSDGLIAVAAFGNLAIGRWQDVAVMSTYIAAQYLIVTGLVDGLGAAADRESQAL